MPVSNLEISQVEPLTKKTFVPSGCTALFDAVGKTINEVAVTNAKSKKKKKKCLLTPGNVIY